MNRKNRSSASSRGISKRTVYILVTGIMIIALIVIASQIVGRKEQGKYDDCYLTAMEAYYDGDYETALSNLRKAIEIEATDDCMNMAVSCYEAQGKYDKCIEVLRQMDVTDSDIQNRIAAYSRLIESKTDSGKINVLGVPYEYTASSLVLKNRGLVSRDLNEIVQLYALTNLCISGNNISDISPLSQLGGLTMLDFSDNNVSSIGCLSGLSGLRTLYMDNNPIEDFTPLYSLSELTTLSIKGIEISDTQLKELSAALPNCAIHSEEAKKSFQDISLGGVTFKSDVSTLDLSGRGISDISALASCTSLKSLDISHNNISDISVLMDLPSLVTVNISDNPVNDIRPLMGVVNLQIVHAENIGITSTVVFSYIPGLTELSLSGNPVTDWSGLSYTKALTALYLKSTGLTDETLTTLYSLTKLKSLNIEDNEELSGEAVDALEKALRRCIITHSDLVYSIEMDGERFREDITEIDLSDRNLTDISKLSGFTMLEKAVLRHNNIRSIYNLQFMKNLKVLDLSYNEVSDVSPLTDMVWLEEINLSNNSVNSVIPFLYLTNLRVLNLSGNVITEAQYNTLREYIPNCEIICEIISSEGIPEEAETVIP